MSYRILLLAYRKPGTTPEEFKAHYEGIHVPLERALAGEYYPSRTRAGTSTALQAEPTMAKRSATPSIPPRSSGARRSTSTSTPSPRLTFEDEAAFQSFFDFMTQPENAAKLAADEELFLDRSKMPIVIVGDCIETKRTDT